MLKVGFVGWRGLVGSILLDRMQDENDFNNLSCEAHFFTTSQLGMNGPQVGGKQQVSPLMDAYNLDDVRSMDIVVSCQGSEYTNDIHFKLRNSGWVGYWIDAASALRMKPESTLILEPVNGQAIEQAIDKGCKDFIGSNCTVSLLLMAINGLVKTGLVEWVSSSSYQAISGGGAKQIKELLQQIGFMHSTLLPNINDTKISVVQLMEQFNALARSPEFPTNDIGYPLLGNLLPWVDSEMPSGQSREEWKAQVEANKLLSLPKNSLKIDGNCVRIASLRTHAQSLTIKLKQSISTQEISQLLAGAHDWVKVIENNKEASLEYLTPLAVSGQLEIVVGRIRNVSLDDKIMSMFTVGDQLLWGAAEPLRRMLLMLIRKL